MTARELPRIGITMGDPAGVGPETIVKALAHEQLYQACRPIVLADAEVMEQAIELAGVPLLLRPVGELGEARFRPATLEVLDVGDDLQKRNLDLEALTPGQPSPSTAKAAVRCVERAMEMALNRAIDGVAAGPIASKGLRAAGCRQANQAELMADLAGSGRRAMMLVAGPLRVASVTGCGMLRTALDQLNRGRIFAAIRLTNQSLQTLGIKNPRIGVAALNPCPGERDPAQEEAREIIPAIEDAKQDRIDVEGPLVAEELLQRLAEGLFDAAVVMYHDQGFPPAKTLRSRFAAAGKAQPAVTVVMGLPAACTVVDDDPQFESAGKGIASEESLLEAIHLAARLGAGS